MNRKTTTYNERTGARITILTDTQGFMRVTLETRGTHALLDSATFTVPQDGPFNVYGLDLVAVRDLLRGQ